MNMQKHLELLGMKVIDRVTGLKGVVTSISFDLSGCIQAAVRPPVKENGTQLEFGWYDVPRLRVLSNKPVMPFPSFESGYVAEGRKGAMEKPAL